MMFSIVAIAAVSDIFRCNLAYRKCIGIAISIMIIFLAGIRWRTGTDWDPYLYIFSNGSSFNSFMSQGYETIFLLMNFIVKSLYDSYTFYLFVIAFIVVWCKYSTFFKISDYPLVCILASLSFYSMDLFTVRQGIAIAITIFSMRYIIPGNESKSKFLLTVAVASGFHITALIFIPAYFIFRMKTSVGRVILFTCIAAAISIAFSAADILSISTNYLPHFVGEKINRYLSLQDADAFSEIPSETRRALGYAKRIIFVIAFAWATNGITNERAKGILRGMFNLFAFSSIMYMLLDSVHPVFSRLAMYYSAAEVFLICSFLYRFKKDAGILIVYFVIIVYLLSRLYYGFGNHPDLFYPYESIFDTTWKLVY
ncbi:EpsG family protein [Citrobacter sp. Cb018]|uniref:EpsG family protein n=1 Tax=Citrobacter sp. Cb018 TaxID=2985016 RepID=UPI00257E7EF8|nr:EpsG family protein [Citrobacter sp. Cb018]MDM3413784.1 EpsG family protein [Citrobacter sp. Cb018]